jgi:hypothetical protein
MGRPSRLHAYSLKRHRCHLQSDHVGWLFDLSAQPVFPNATSSYSAGDRDHFVTGPGEMADHIRAGFTGESRLHALTGDTTVAPGVTALLAPRHAPGHLCVVLSSGEDRSRAARLRPPLDHITLRRSRASRLVTKEEP